MPDHRRYKLHNIEPNYSMNWNLSDILFWINTSKNSDFLLHLISLLFCVVAQLLDERITAQKKESTLTAKYSFVLVNLHNHTLPPIPCPSFWTCIILSLLNNYKKENKTKKDWRPQILHSNAIMNDYRSWESIYYKNNTFVPYESVC